MGVFFVRFWGVRGSVACPGTETLKYGGNTTCLEIRAGGKLAIIDMGTGIVALGKCLASHDMKDSPLDADIFLTHTHMDHISGFQMFAPLFDGKNTLRIRGPHIPGGESLRTILERQMSYAYWPIRMNELPASLSFERIGETVLDLGDGLVCRSKYLNHTAVCLGYRFEYEGKSIATAFDTEPWWNIFRGSASFDEKNDFFSYDAVRMAEMVLREEKKRQLEFYRDADVLICDTQYTDDEYPDCKRNWGHSTMKTAVEMANSAGAKKLLLFHHDPERTDAVLERLEAECKKECRRKAGLQIIASREGLVVEA